MAKINIYDNKLTPSAKEALNETMLELQDLLLNKANLIARQGLTADKEISLRDILEAKETLFKAKIEKEKVDYKRKRLMTIISLTGAFYSLLGVLVYIYQNQNFILEKNIGLIITLTGIITIFFGFAYTQLLSRRYEEKQNTDSEYKDSEDDFEVIRKWQIIERLASNIMRQKGHTNNESKSINDILRFLSIELQSDKLHNELRELLSVRNKILHQEYVLSRQEKQVYLDKAEKIINELETLEK